MTRKPKPDFIDKDAPEADEAWFDKSLPASEVLPKLFGNADAREMLKPKRGRPQLASPKEHVNIRLDADIVRSFKEAGSGWQTRLNNALREWLRSHA
ncbi:MAG: BrnA antitoxin family protein [Burkholderiaceae bacterium]